MNPFASVLNVVYYESFEWWNSPKPRPMFLQNAAVHDHNNARPPRLFRRFFIDHTFLHPDRRHL